MAKRSRSVPAAETSSDDDTLQPALPEIERKRLQNIQRNKEEMEKLCISEDVAALQQPMKKQKTEEELKQVKEAAEQKKLELQKAAAEKGPRPIRFEGQERPNYDESKANKQLFQIVVRPRGAPKKQPKTRPNTGGGSKRKDGSTKFPTWSTITIRAPMAARQAARQAAQELMRRMNRPAWVRVMRKSHVSKGFWLACGKLARHLKVDEFITFTCYDRTRPVEAFTHNQASLEDGGDPYKWDALLHVADSGGIGFSGGWRGIAIDLFLHAGDVVVIEVTSKTTVDLHIFRAWDFADADSKPADLEELRFKAITAAQEAAALDAEAEYSDEYTADKEDDAGLARELPASSSKGSKAVKVSMKQQQQQEKKNEKAAPAEAAAAGKGKGGKGSTKGAAAAAGKVSAAKRAEKGAGSKAHKAGTSAAAGAAAAAERAGGGSRLAGSKRKAAAAAAAAAVVKQQPSSSSGSTEAEQPACGRRKPARAAMLDTGAAAGAADASSEDAAADAAAADATETHEMQAAPVSRRQKVSAAGAAGAAAAAAAAEVVSTQQQDMHLMADQDMPPAAAAAAEDVGGPAAEAAEPVAAKGRLSWFTKLLSPLR